MKTYTITTDGSSSGNVIAQPFTITVTSMNYIDENGISRLQIGTCCENSLGNHCVNDDVAPVLNYDLPSMSASKNADLAATLEVLLQEVYPDNWS
jgi:hypothetical protein